MGGEDDRNGGESTGKDLEMKRTWKTKKEAAVTQGGHRNPY